MTARDRNDGFAARPRDTESSIRAPDPFSPGGAGAGFYGARITIDITPTLRGRIKVAAFQRGATVGDMLPICSRANFPRPMESARES
jgi:hypothetical protein